jgi:hypothetical protein
MDDTIVNITNLMRLIRRLNLVYDPTRELVLRAFANSEFRRYNWKRMLFLGGGSGWLMSRPMVEVHRHRRYSLREHWEAAFRGQDDTAESLIVNKVFASYRTWADPLYIERCFNCEGSQFERGNWSSINKCPRMRTFSMNSIVAFHPASSSAAMKAGMMIGKYPPNIHYFHVGSSIGSLVCLQEGWRGHHERLELYPQHITLDMLQ